MNILENTKLNRHGFQVLRKGTRSGSDIRLHVLLVERRRGGPIPKDENGECWYVIHLDREKSNNDLSNLKEMSKKDFGKRRRKLAALAGWFPSHYRKCSICKIFDDPKNMVIDRHYCRHQECNRKASLEYSRKNKDKRKIYHQKNKEDIKNYKNTIKDSENKNSRLRRAKAKAAKAAEFKTDLTPVEAFERATGWKSSAVKRKGASTCRVESKAL